VITAPGSERTTAPARTRNSAWLKQVPSCTGDGCGLIFTTLLGMYMAFKCSRSHAVIWTALFAGVLMPAGLIAILAGF